MKISKSLGSAIRTTVLHCGSLAKPKSKSWYKEHPDQIPHHSFHNLNDALAASFKEKVWIVYLRENKRHDPVTKLEYSELSTMRQLKVGKGSFLKGETRDASAGGSSGLLNTLAAIACIDEQAAFALEELLHDELKRQGRWVERVENDAGKKSGREWFDGWSPNPVDAIDEFNALVSVVTSNTVVGKTMFSPRAYQYKDKIKGKSGAQLVLEFLLAGGDMRDFFLLMKPRSGKNCTVLLGIAMYVKAIKEQNPDFQCVLFDFLSQWPSAFSGLVKDAKKYIFIEGVQIGTVNTGEPCWEEKLAELRLTCDAVIRLASVQSIIKYFADEDKAEDDRNEFEGTLIQYDEHKAEKFINDPASYVIIDECDHGMRTPKSKRALSSFGYCKYIWMSGSDLYALRHEVVIGSGNHFVYDMFQEIQDVIDGKFGSEVRSRIRKHSLEADVLPYEELSPDMMDSRGVSRRITNLFKSSVVRKGKITYFSKLDRWIDSNGIEIKFDRPGEVIRLVEIIYFWENDIGVRAPEDHIHIFWSMPSVVSCYALYNLIKSGAIAGFKHLPLVANSYGAAIDIEADVNADMTRHKKTVFITVGRMLRGAKASWSAVVRCDERSDWKIGHQLELRGQNTNELFFDVYDANVFRSESISYELIRSRTDGKKIDTEGRALHNLIPMTRKGKFSSRASTWEDCTESYQADSIIEGYKRNTIFDNHGLAAAKDLLAGVSQERGKSGKKKDDRAGKLGLAPNKTNVSTPKTGKDPLIELRQQAITIATMLPMLICLSDGRYPEIDDLIENTKQPILESWLTHCNIGCGNLGIDTIKNLIIGLFDMERINEQLSITCNRYKKDGIESFDWGEFAQPNKGDVPTPGSAASSLLMRLPDDFWSTEKYCFDPSCGTGEFPIMMAEFFRSEGMDPAKYIFFDDPNLLNRMITTKRLGFNNSLCYNKLEIGIDKKGRPRKATPTEVKTDMKKQLMDKFGRMTFDLYATNPPFQKPGPGGRDDDNLWPSFVKLGKELTKDCAGYVLMVTPGSWASLGTNSEAPGSKIRKTCFDSSRVIYVDFTMGTHFTEGSTFTGYIIQNLPPDPSIDTTFVFSDKETIGKFSDQLCFPLKFSNSEFGEIIEAFKAKKPYDIVSEDPYHSPRYPMPKKLLNGDFSDKQTPDHPYRSYHTNSKKVAGAVGPATHRWSAYKNSFHKQWKAVFSYSGSWAVEATTDCSLTDASMCVLCASEQEAKSVQSVLQSQPIRFLIDKVFRWSGYYSAAFIKMIPELPRNKIYTDQEVYSLLFTPEQTALIKKLVVKK